MGDVGVKVKVEEQVMMCETVGEGDASRTKRGGQGSRGEESVTHLSPHGR